MPERETGVSAAGASGVKLPEIVRRYLERALPGDRAVPRQVRITQEGQMWQKPGARAMHFTATQHFAVDHVAFSWHASFPVVRPIAIKVVDEYADGDGRLEARVLGFPMKRNEGPETVRGEALRYLAELPWVPYAMAHNPELEWRELDDRAAEVAAIVRGDRLVVNVEFDDAGDIVRGSSQMRPLESGRAWQPTPWGGEFRDYKTFNGIRVPTWAEVYWELPEGRFVYWRGTVSSAIALDQPFARNKRMSSYRSEQTRCNAGDRRGDRTDAERSGSHDVHAALTRG